MLSLFLQQEPHRRQAAAHEIRSSKRVVATASTLAALFLPYQVASATLLAEADGAAKEHASHKRALPSKPDPVLDQIKALLASNKTSEAEKQLISYIGDHPDFTEARLLYANALYGDQRYFACIDQCQKVVAAQADCAEAWHYLGNCYQQIHKPASALDAYRKFVALSKEPQPQYETLINLLQETKDNDPGRNFSAGDNYLSAVTENGLFRWTHTSPIKVFINSGEGVAEYRPEFEESLRQAFEDWSEASGHKFVFDIQEHEDHPDIIVSWTADLHAPEFSAEAGDCRLQCGPDGLESATIRLLTVDPFKQAPLGKEALHAVCLHEIGHALGLQGHSGVEGDIMYPVLKEDAISARDMHTLYALYSPDLQDASSLRAVDAYGRALPKESIAERLVADGSNAAVSGNLARAKDLLERALAIDPQNKLARSNLAVCTNNLAIDGKHSNNESMKLLYEALYWQPDCQSAKDNLKSMYGTASDTTSFSFHAAQAAQRFHEGDLMGAVVEYRFALSLKEDAAVRAKLANCEQRLTSASTSR